MRKKTKYWFLLISAMACWVLSTTSANAVDEMLFLTGVIKTVDARSGIITIDVKSDSCPGTRRFPVDDAHAYRGLEGDEMCFYIDSSICTSARIVKVVRLSKDGKL